jgi:hypothetical protein
MNPEMDYLDQLVTWFKSQGGELDSSVMGFQNFLEYGRGAVAKRNIPVRQFFL